MIINHNIAALNTYRQLSNNNVMSNKSLEKLSSGLRINRAGDDAAGLAISEKMRAQIRGLDQASRNAQDGISMIQTAEGALNETHSILQRMRELANQAASDTNVKVDRDEIQKEINQLTSEINRIGNTTEFNTQKLLDGGRQIKANATASSATLINGSAAVTSNMTTSSAEAGVAATAATKTATSNAVYATNIDAFDDSDKITLTIDGTAYSVKGSDIKDAKGGGFSSEAQFATWLGANLKSEGGAAVNTVATIELDTGKLKVTTTSTLGTSSSVQWEQAGTNVADLRTFTGIAVGDEGAANKSAGADATAASIQIDFDDAVGDGAKIRLYDGKVIGAYDSTAEQYKGMSNDQIKQALGADYLMDISGDATAANSLARFEALHINNFTITNVDADSAKITYNAAGPQSGNMASIDPDVAQARAASGNITFTSKPTEGSTITIGDKKIGFFDSSSETYANGVAAKAEMGADIVIDIKGLSLQKTVDAIVGMNSPLNALLSTEVTLSRENNADGSINLRVVGAEAGVAANLVTLGVSADSTAGFKAKLQIGANFAQSMTLNVVDMRSNALGVTGDGIKTTVTANDGAVASYVSLANVTNGTTDENVEHALDVSTHDKATAAISVIQDAIETVSAERSKLGAYQNRLEHTINNLGTSSENLSAAESRIRDVDMAKEIMEFTKMNILSQAAQAMLEVPAA